MVHTESSVQWDSCETPAQQGAILERAIAHLDDWLEALKREVTKHMAWSAARFRQANQQTDQDAFIKIIVEHWNHAAQAARFKKSQRSWAAIRKILDRMKDNCNQHYRIVLAEQQDLAATKEEKKLLYSLERRLLRDSRRAETLAYTDDPTAYPNGIWADLSPSDIISNYDSDDMEEAHAFAGDGLGSGIIGDFS
jgi:uncharacterized protein (DUF305 family)